MTWHVNHVRCRARVDVFLDGQLIRHPYVVPRRLMISAQSDSAGLAVHSRHTQIGINSNGESEAPDETARLHR